MCAGGKYRHIEKSLQVHKGDDQFYPRLGEF